MALATIDFALAGIETLQFALFEENISSKKTASIGLKTKIEFGVDPKEKVLIVSVTFIFEQLKKPLIKIEVRCDYFIAAETWESFCKNNIISFPVGFMRHLGVICIGTSRGVLHAKTENTKFNDFILPIISVEDLIANDVIFQLDEEE